ncbi:alpha/beta hydrolase [Geodermatophilus sp. YIM 151500]|uniref:alpha/beta fold hydrolase n=1 Tax=Geodermatophilus sp. YIM 151500 TaxID=2984531 RepID=UPI0021E39D9E|nr:alpha/beta hydrolase [Geodermatophilus sp. YIM 151500]MCV2488103.1 alpha/beta hydrolase [Geodermatophilus sp. YIM 151500]
MAVIGVTGGGGFGALQYVTLDGVSLAYREVGTGGPVVLVHGGLADMRTWGAQLEPLRARLRAIACSRRYARPDEAIAPGATDPVPVHVDDLVALLHAPGASPAHLVGNSWGAFVCLPTAIRHPDVVRSLVLEEPPVLPLVLGSGPRPQPSVLARSLRRRPRATLAVLAFGLRTSAPMAWAYRRGDADRALQLFARGVLGRQALARLTSQRRQQMRGTAAELQAEFRAGFPPLTETEVRGVRAPGPAAHRRAQPGRRGLAHHVARRPAAPRRAGGRAGRVAPHARGRPRVRERRHRRLRHPSVGRAVTQHPLVPTTTR